MIVRKILALSLSALLLAASGCGRPGGENASSTIPSPASSSSAPDSSSSGVSGSVMPASSAAASAVSSKPVSDGETSSKSSSAEGASSAAPSSSEAASNSGEWIAYDTNKDTYKLHIKKADGSEDKVIVNDPVLAPCVAGDWVYYIAPLDDIYKVRLDGSQKTKVCGTTDMHALNANAAVTAEYTNGYILYKLVQLRQIGEDLPNTVTYYKLDLKQNKITETNAPAVSSSVPQTSPNSQTAVGQWAEEAPMSLSRYAFGMEAVSGKLYAIGGDGGGGKLNSVEEYDIGTNRWSTKKPMPTARSDFQTVLLDGKIYAVGGEGKERYSSAAVERYDPAADTWTELAPMKTPRDYFRTAILDGRIYAIGGSDDSSFVPLVEAYDPSTDTWTEKAPLPVAKKQFQAETVNGKLYVIGGFEPTGVVSSVEAYDPMTNQWTRKASMQTPRAAFQTEIVNGKIYAIGGVNDQVDALASVEEYDPLKDQWVSKKSMGSAKSWFQTAAVNGKIIAVGGWKKAGDFSRDQFLCAVEEYDLNTDTWAEEAPLFTPRGWFRSAVAGGRLYALGGAGGSVGSVMEPGLASLEAYRFQ